MRVGKMWKHALLLVCISGCCLAGPLHGIKRNVPIVMRDEQETVAAEEPLAPEYPEMPSTMTLPSNATSIRSDITDNFKCDDKVYGYYADVENDCQIFHICLPVTYADGKENTFRWSFICPEETVFSQDSFTCMRREDMSIACEDSVRYYELNHNFGVSEENGMNSNSAQSIAEQVEEQPSPSEAMQPNMELPVMVEEPLETAAAPTPALAQPKPMKEKPMKLPKPYRRKPQPKPQQEQATYYTNKQPSIMPLRKMPNVGTKLSISQPAEEIAKPEVETESKPIPSRYKKRPAVTFNSDKEITKSPAPPFKVETVYSASNPDSYKRKRPTFAHKTNVAEDKVDEKVAVVETVPEPAAIEPVESTVKFESNLGSVPEPAPVDEETEKINEPLAPTVEDTPVALNPIHVVEDTEQQASETGEVIVAPENALKTVDSQQIATENEATQLKDVVIAEAVLEQDNKDEENAVVEESAKNEESIAQEITNAVAEIASPENAQAADETNAPIEAIGEIPALISEYAGDVSEPEPLIETANQLSNSEAPSQPEMQLVPEQPAEIADQLTGASEPTALGIVPEANAPIENSEEALPALPLLEELEEQKPADAVEAMVATPEMEQQDPIVQQAFAEKDSHLQSVGGFKPVDPDLAAEAEALLSDFVSALKSDHPNVKPMLTLPIDEEVTAVATDSEGNKVEIEEPQLSENQNLEVDVKQEATPVVAEADSNALKTITVEQPESPSVDKEITLPENLSPAEEDVVKDSPMLKFPISNSFPANMYQIPVTVIQTPYEEIVNVAESEMPEAQKNDEEQEKFDEPQSEIEAQAQKEKDEEVKTLTEESASHQTEQEEEQKVDDIPAAAAQLEVTQSETTEDVEVQPDAAQPETISVQPAAEDHKPEAEQPAAPVAFRPISIDDIVELVKERLDQTPADEKGTPMELIMEPANADKPIELKLSTQQKGTATQEESAEHTPAEDIIFPIYHRLSEDINSDAKAPEVNAVDEPIALVTEIEKLPAEATAVKSLAAPIVQTIDQMVQTGADSLESNVDKTALPSTMNTKTETIALPMQESENLPTAEVATPDAPKQINTDELAGNVKAKRAFRSRSLAKGKLDPRKRRFLFKADAS